MTSALISLDVGGTLATVNGTTLPALLVAASPLEASKARLIVRRHLHTHPHITEAVVAQVCTALELPESAFPRNPRAAPVHLVPGAVAAARRLSQLATVVTLSNVTCLDAGTTELRAALSPWISDHFPSSRIGYAKPDAAAFEAVALACGSTTADMVHIGDDWQCDVLGAVAVGAKAVWISHHRPVPDVDLLRDHDILVTTDLPAASRLVADRVAERRTRRRR